MEIPATDWAAVKAVFHEASELTPADRAAFLATACAGNVALQREVESLLARAAADPAFLETPIVSLLPAAERPDAQPPRLIGPYRVTSLVGRGGMGTVYAATRADDIYQRRVAIKVVNRGMDTEDVVQRFRAERQTLARLDHPNIARIIDGGTTGDGLPYFVMDYVDGVPIDNYCDRARLTIPRRIDLFRSVCSAVSYAHQNLVVHRDLKPENILVTGDGVVKLLDFGVAKLLDGGDAEPPRDVTRLPERRMTLSHASPEQVRGLPITTTTDVYSLGVLLYTLLCGHRPYRVSDVSSDEAARTICEVTGRPPSAWLEQALAQDINAPTPEAIAAARSTNPSALRRELAGDPDRIVAMALRKEPERRYASVELLSEDLHRYLRGLPVIARADTFGYRARKFATRHRVGVVAAGVAGLALAGGVATTLWQARVAQAERRTAERRFSDVRQLANALLFEIHDAIATLPGSTRAKELLIRRALEYVDTLAAESSNDHALQLDLAIAYQRIGDVQGNPTNENLGDLVAAEASYRKGITITEPLVTAGIAGARLHLARLYQKLGDTRAFLGDPTSAVAAMRRALDLSQAEAAAVKAGPPEADDGAARLSWAVSLIKLADVEGHPDFPNAGAPDRATASYRDALAIVTDLPATMRAPRLRYLGLLHERLGRMSEAREALPDALRHYRESLAFRREWSTTEPTHVGARRDFGIAHEKIGDVLRRSGDLAGALDSHRTAGGIYDELLRADPNNAMAGRTMAVNREHMADILAESGDRAGAETEYRAALDIDQRLLEQAPGNVQVQGDVTRLTESLARLAATPARRPSR